jgi:hypothetical protein
MAAIIVYLLAQFSDILHAKQKMLIPLQEWHSYKHEESCDIIINLEMCKCHIIIIAFDRLSVRSMDPSVRWIDAIIYHSIKFTKSLF